LLSPFIIECFIFLDLDDPFNGQSTGPEYKKKANRYGMHTFGMNCISAQGEVLKMSEDFFDELSCFPGN